MSVGVFNTADNFSSLSGTTKASSSPYNVNVNNTNSGYQGPGNSYLGTPAAIESNEINNSGQDQTGPDSFGDVTVINTAVAFNATFAADNIFTGVGSIGLYGRSRGLGTEANNPGNPVSPPNEPNDWSIGVLGQSSKGCGMYGLATDDNPTTTPDQPSHGIGASAAPLAERPWKTRPWSK
jgi:hypothetical protein